MTYLSRLPLNVRSQDVQRDLADCHRLHGRILSGFPTELGLQVARERFGVLYRLETGGPRVQVLLQSQYEPDWSRLPDGYLSRPPECKSVDGAYSRIGPGAVLIFRLRANPTRRIGRGHEDPRWRGKRVDLRREEDQLQWLARKAEQGGFRLLHASVSGRSSPGGEVPDTRVAPGVSVTGRRTSAATGGRQQLTFGSVLFEGQLQVTDAEQFRTTLLGGIGSGKAYGFGLLSVIPAGNSEGGTP